MKAVPPQSPLYELVRDGLLAGEGAGLVDPARAVYEFEGHSERSAVALAICLHRAGDAAGADTVLALATKTRGETATLLLNRAKVAVDDVVADRFLKAALHKDGNHEAALLWWAARLRLRLDDKAWRAALERHAAVAGNWRVHLLLYGNALEQKDAVLAAKHLGRALAVGVDKGAVAAEIAVVLDRAEAWADVATLFFPWKPVHGLRAAERLVRALFKLGRAKDARSVLAQLEAWKPAKNTRALIEARAHVAAAAVVAVDETTPKTLAGLAVAAPLASLVFGGAAVRAEVAVAAFVDEASAVVAAGEVEGDERSTLCRGLALALAEAFAAVKVPAFTLLPAVPAAGLVSPRLRLTLEQTLALLPRQHLPRLLITGRVCADAIEVNLFNVAGNVDVGTVRVSTDAAPGEIRDSICAALVPHCKTVRVAAPQGTLPPVALALAAPLLLRHVNADVGPEPTQADSPGSGSGSDDAAARAVALLQAGTTAEKTLALALVLALGKRHASKAPNPANTTTPSAPLQNLARELVADPALAGRRAAVDAVFPRR